MNGIEDELKTLFANLKNLVCFMSNELFDVLEHEEKYQYIIRKEKLFLHMHRIHNFFTEIKNELFPRKDGIYIKTFLEPKNLSEILVSDSDIASDYD